MSQKPETVFKNRILPILQAIPGTFWEKIQQKSIRGTPDILGVANGRAVAIELKTDVGDTDALQEYKLGRWWKAGAETFVMTPSTFEKDLAAIKKLAQNQP